MCLCDQAVRVVARVGPKPVKTASPVEWGALKFKYASACEGAKSAFVRRA